MVGMCISYFIISIVGVRLLEKKNKIDKSETVFIL